MVVCRSDKTLRRHPTLLQPMMALRLSGQQTPYIPCIKKAAFAAFWCCLTMCLLSLLCFLCPRFDHA
ncbi:hypothetical protein D6K49_20380 [Salmonella enterica subsp. enterica serovar Fluntern]|nr:hypothetical protein [Salmonella enterica subsp. enterica serovar Fluntern]